MRDYIETDTLPEWVQYTKDMPNGPTPARWSGEEPPPAIGSTVHVRMNSIGAARVVKFFVEDGFLGLLVKPVKPPRWYVKQNGDKPCHVFGIELGKA